MGFFNKVGRRAEKLKQQFSDAAEEGAMFECADCGKGIFTKKETCPACGSEAVVPREEPEEEPESESAEASEDGAAAEMEGDLPADIERVEFETEVDETDDSDTRDPTDGDEDTP